MSRGTAGLFMDEDIDILIQDAIDILREAENEDAVLSFSGGVDSEVIADIISRNEINIDAIFYNMEVEPNGNKARIREVSKRFKEVFDAKTEAYKDIVYRLGFPIKNKNFSELCYRLKTMPLCENNLKDKYRIVTGVSPTMINETKKVNMKFSLPLKYWYLAMNYPIQMSCCRILKKEPANKVHRPMIIGIMKDDSDARRRAISQAYHGKFFPLRNWTKKHIFYYLEKYGVEYSREYKDIEVSDNEVVVGATNTGCIGCHYGNTVNHYVIIDGVKEETTKFANLKRKKPKQYKYIMNMKHHTGITFSETLRAYERSRNGDFIEESYVLRNKMISDIEKLMMRIGLTHFDDGALELLQKFKNKDKNV